MDKEVNFETEEIKLSEFKRNGHCNMCGMCCKAIRLGKCFDQIAKAAQEEIQKHSDLAEIQIKSNAYKDDILFIYYNWLPITEEEAYKINPCFNTWYQDEWSKQYKDKSYYYKCKQFDETTSKCMVHEHKPHVCSDFPYYGGNLDKSFCFYSENCGYKIDAVEVRHD